MQVAKMTVNGFPLSGRKRSLPSRIIDIMRFQESFPSNTSIDNLHMSRSAKSLLTPSLTCSKSSDKFSNMRSISENDISNPMIYVGKDSWGGRLNGGNSLRVPANRDNCKSSTVSLPDVIEEVSSDEELTDEQNIDYDYMRCEGCKIASSSTSLDNLTNLPDNLMSYCPTSQQIRYCYKCKHLFQGNNKKSNLNVPSNNNIDNRRRKNWTCIDAPYSPSASRKNSGVEMPIINEPSIDEDDIDTELMQKIVNKEVDNLIKLNHINEVKSKAVFL